MKNKEKILKLDIALQLILFFGIVFTAIIEDDAFLFFFFLFAITQVVSGFLYTDERKMAYLKTLFWINVFGTGLIFFCGLLINEFIAYLLFLFCWGISPVFLAIWAFTNSCLALKETFNIEKELENEFV